MALSLYQVGLVVGMLITGSINTLSKKAQNDCNVVGRKPDGVNSTAEAHDFDHPWFQTVIMFLGESLCLIGLMVFRRQERNRFRRQVNLGDIQGEDRPIPVETEFKQPRIFQWVFILPTCCDLLGTTLAGIGLLYVTASVWQMLRGSIIIFTGIFSIIFFKRKLKCYQWTGIIFTMFGLALVGSASIFEDQNPKALYETAIGIVLILAGQACNAFQMVVEEIFLKKRGYPPLQVVGMEGSFGFWIMCLIVLPALYFIPDDSAYTGRYEDSIDALMQIGNSPKLLIFCLLYLFSITFYNYFGLAVTKSLTAVHRTLIDACRTIVVWVTDLLIYYAFGQKFGEPFNVTYGILQVDGFLFLIIGTSLYNGLIDLSFIPGLRDQNPNAPTEQPEPESPTPVNTDEYNEEVSETAPLLKNRRGQNYD